MTARQHLRIVDVKREFNVSRRTVNRWIASGKLKVLKFGSTMQSAVRIPREELERFRAEAKR